MAALRQLRWPERRDDQQAHRAEPIGEIAEQVDRRGVGPVQVVEKHDHGCSREASSSSAAISRFIRVGDPAPASASARSADWSSLELRTCAYQFGATLLTTRTRLPWLSDLSRLSSASRNGRYASLPASRSEHRPRATRAAPDCPTAARNSSTSAVLPRPGSPETVTTDRTLAGLVEGLQQVVHLAIPPDDARGRAGERSRRRRR